MRTNSRFVAWVRATIAWFIIFGAAWGVILLAVSRGGGV